MNQPEPTAAKVLDAVEARLIDERTLPTRRRYGRARAQLEVYLEARGDGMLLDAGAAMLELERSVEPRGALLRVATGEDLLYALPGFIGLDRPSLPTSDVRAQLRFAEECRRFIDRHGLVDGYAHQCAIWEVDGALRQARRALRSG